MPRGGVFCRVTSRAKEIDSFVKKLIRTPQPYDDVYDKAGVRIVPTYPDERAALHQLVQEVFDVSLDPRLRE